MWVSKREYDSLEKQIAYWQAQYEVEKTRADRLVNSLLQTNGLPPASPLDHATSGEDHESPRLRKLAMLVPELLADEIEDKLEPDEVAEQ